MRVLLLAMLFATFASAEERKPTPGPTPLTTDQKFELMQMQAQLAGLQAAMSNALTRWYETPEGRLYLQLKADVTAADQALRLRFAELQKKSNADGKVLSEKLEWKDPPK